MIKLVFFATPEIAVESLKKLQSFNDIKIMAVVTQPDRPCGRGKEVCAPPIKIGAQRTGVEVFQTASIKKDAQLIEKLKELEPDFFVTFAFGQILSQEVLDIPKMGTINLHASLLPKYRGANPIQRAIVNGEIETGICTMLTALGLDEGDVCLCEKIKITPNMTAPQLSEIISENAPYLIYKTLIGLQKNEIIPQKQDGQKATYANKFKKTDGFIDFQNSAIDIHNKIRGLLAWPCAYFEFKQKNIKLLQSEVLENEKIHENTGEILSITKDGLEIAAQKGSVLIKTLQPQGKTPMDATSWINGAKLKVGDKINDK